MKREWQRETRLCQTIGLRSDLLAALRAHIERHELDGAEAQALVCFETQSQRLKRPGLLMRMAGAGNKSMVTAVIVTPTRLIWAQATEDKEPWAISELLATLEVTDYEKDRTSFDIMPDNGVRVFGVHAQGGTVGSLFFGLGEGPDADRARRILKDAVRAAHGEGPPVSDGSSSA